MTIKITMDRVASYTSPVIFESDKKTTLIYGLNGTGKSTFANYVYDQANAKFAKCQMEGLNDARVYSYCSGFVKDNFHELDKLKGIFTLSKVNKEVEEELTKKRDSLRALRLQHDIKKSEISGLENSLAKDKNDAEEVTWKIKTTFSGGDRVLEYCLDGLKAKTRLFEHLAQVELPSSKPKKTYIDLKKEIEAIKGEGAQRHDGITKLSTSGTAHEEIEIFETAIVGNKNSTVAQLLTKLDNADWVNEGLPFLELLQNEGDETCPFCQTKTVTKTVADAIRNYFDETFATALETIKQIQEEYKTFTSAVPALADFLSNPILKEKKGSEFETLYARLQSNFTSNIDRIERKIKAPSNAIKLESSQTILSQLNDIIDFVNDLIKDHNAKIERKKDTLNEIKTEFWEICRWDYDQTILMFNTIEKKSVAKVKEGREKLLTIDTSIQQLTTDVAAIQKKTINVDAAIASINMRLTGLGIDSFKIIRHGESTYRLSRNGESADDFQSLSEGEKTIISFIYFVELCKGKSAVDDVADRKIIVIDDPISSLSHIYVFNVGRIIFHELCASDQFEKIIVLTHSLYFFYELADNRSDKRKANQKLLRLVKNTAGANVFEMKYEEVQNDYQAYWTVVMDEKQHPALIANCMRNIVEYFFNFVQKRDFNNVFQNAQFADQKYQAFYRFMNRESHSLGQNIIDTKEFNYTIFRDAFKLLFDESGYSEHYLAMTK